MKLELGFNHRPSPEDMPFELVERKGKGHPDTLCDAIAERASRYYAQYCLSNFGRIAHHWFDKVMLIGGESQIEFGRGSLVRPFTLIFAGKAARLVGQHEIPLEDILHRASADVLTEVLQGFDPQQHLTIDCRVRDSRGPGQATLRYRPGRVEDLPTPGAPQLSNDCSLCVGYAPLSRLERLVLITERFLNDDAFKTRYPDTGTDVKVVGRRCENAFQLLVNLPFIANRIPDRRTYELREAQVGAELRAQIERELGGDVAISINPEDRHGRTYLTATGTVADTGDVGVVGRGNRPNGLISPMRQMSIEAAAGKNPIDHGGKIYSVVAMTLANKINEQEGVPAVVYVATSKGAPLATPDAVFVELDARNVSSAVAGIQERIRNTVEFELAQVNNLTRDFVEGRRALW